MDNSNLASTYNQTLPSSQDKLCDLYDRWANNYDKDYIEFGYEGPRTLVETLMTFLDDKNGKIIDFGSGTGLVGEQLKVHGFCNLHALDMSRDSLNIAREKQLYKSFTCARIGSCSLPIEAGTFDALVTCGTFAPSHLNHSCFPEMWRLVKPGGIIVISMREEYLWNASEFNDNKFENAVQDLVDNGKWKVVSRLTYPNHFHDKDGLVLVFKVFK